MESVLRHYLMVLLPVIEPTASEREDYTQWMLPLANSEPLLMYSLMGTKPSVSARMVDRAIRIIARSVIS